MITYHGILTEIALFKIRQKNKTLLDNTVTNYLDSSANSTKIKRSEFDTISSLVLM